MSSTPDKSGLGSFPFARRYLGNRTFFLFLRVLRCFSSPGVPSYTYFIECMILEGCSSRFPHSEISGSVSICDSPKHIGAYPVLHRLLVPRHSPYALNNLTYLLYIFFAICSFQCSCLLRAHSLFRSRCSLHCPFCLQFALLIGQKGNVQFKYIS